MWPQTDKEYIPNIFDCHLKTSYQILIIFGTNIPDTTCHKVTIQFFTLPIVCFCTTWGKQTKHNTCWNELKNVDKFHLSRSVDPNSQSITKFDCHATMPLPDDIQKWLWIHKATGKAWIGPEQTIIDTAVNEWRKHLHASMCSYNKPIFRAIFIIDSWKKTTR